METLRRIERGLARVEGWFIIALLAAMVGLTFFQVLLRNLYAYGGVQEANLILGEIDWAEPLVRLSVLWLTFLGASMVTGENRHIKIDLLTGILPRAWQPFRELILCIGSALVCSFMVKASLDYVGMEFQAGVTPFLGIPSWVTQLILPIGFFLIVLRFLARAAWELAALLKERRR